MAGTAAVSPAKVDSTSKPIAVGRVVMNAIRKLQGKDGITLVTLKNHLKHSKHAERIHEPDVKFFLKNALDRGVLVREGGNYKVKEISTRTRNGAKDVKSVRTVSKNQERPPAKKSSRTKGGKTAEAESQPRKLSPVKKSSRNKRAKSSETRKEPRKHSSSKISRTKGSKKKLSRRKKTGNKVVQSAENQLEHEDNAKEVIPSSKVPDTRAAEENVPRVEILELREG